MTILFRCLIVFLVVVFGSLENVHRKSACFKMRITSKGLNLVFEDINVMDELAIMIYMSSDLKHQHGQVDDAEYALTDLQVTDFTEPQSNIESLTGTGLRLNANGAGVSMTGFFHFSNKWIPYIGGAGNLDVIISGLDFSMNLNFGVDPIGRPTFTATDYSCKTSGVSITFDGGWLILFSRMLEDHVKRTLRTIICESLMKRINRIVEAKLSFPVTKQLFPGFVLDFGLLQVPNFQSSYMETFHKCEISLFGVKTAFPYEPPTMADTGDIEKRTYFWISEYMFNTLGYAAHLHNFLAISFTAADVPPHKRGLFNTTCMSSECLGILFPDGTFPDSTLEFKIFSNTNPTMTITPKDIKVHCALKIAVYARQWNNTLADVMSLIVTVKTSVTVSISEVMYWKVNYIKFLVSEMNSYVGPNEIGILQTLINNVLKVHLIPLINEAGQQGYPFLLSKEFPILRTEKYISSKSSVRILEHAILIEDVLI